jgi:hypothetical protein
MAGSPPADKQNRRWGGLNGLKVVDVKMLKNKLKHFVEENPVKTVLGFLVSDIADSLGERTADEMMAAPLEEQKEHKYNVLGCGYTRIDGKYDVGRKLGEGSFAKVRVLEHLVPLCLNQRQAYLVSTITAREVSDCECRYLHYFQRRAEA